MDSITHALVAAILFYAFGLPQLLPYAVIGVVIIDTDILFSLVSRNYSSFYLFIHGGISHSLAGAIVMSVLAYAGIGLAAFLGLVNPLFISGTGLAGFAAVLAGAFLHLAMDLPATPGIPLFAPVSDRKYSLFLLPGPSLLLMGASLFFLLWMALGVVTFAEGIKGYAAIFGVFLLVRCIAFLVSRPALRGAVCAIPQANPLRWLSINETPDAWMVRDYRIGFKPEEPVIYPKFIGITAPEVAPYLGLPEVKRLQYHSFIVTVEREGDTIIFSDPLRVSGRIFYPPHFKQVRITAGDQTIGSDAVHE